MLSLHGTVEGENSPPSEDIVQLYLLYKNFAEHLDFWDCDYSCDVSYCLYVHESEFLIM